ncbi:hypothetical protein WSM22_06780 [Cytophagales bacterium WSM2-2]|nr:hypothetical protein WSM22_06780 [Cytophagales bacterium WSM2-2]
MALKDKITYLCNPANWTKLSTEDHTHSGTRQNILFSQLCILGAFFVIIQSIDDFVELNAILMMIDVGAFSLMLICYRLNELGHHRLSKCILLGVLNGLFFFLSAVIAPISKIDLLFYPLLILTFMTLGKKDIVIGFIFVVVSFILLITLELTNHQPFGEIELQKGNRTQAIINIFTACFFIGLSAIFFITIQHKVERSLRKKKDELTKANAELDKFVYSASHDLRAPLLSIQGLVNIALLENNIEQSATYLKMIRERALKLDDFVKEVTNYSRNARLDLEIKPVNLLDAVDEAFAKIKYMENVQLISISKEIIGSPVTHTDKGRLSILINNLLSNSVKYHDLKKEKPFINLVIENDYKYLKILVKDNGTGIKGEHLGKIFNMFYRAAENSQGSGLGLYIVKELVEKLKGKVSVKSEWGIGTTFEIIIPHHSSPSPELMLKVA